MNLNDLLISKSISPQQVLVMRHRPSERELNKVLSWLAAEKPNVFNAYQQTQGEKVEKAMLRAKYFASFIGRAPGKALFVGLYAVKGSRSITRKEYREVPENIELQSFGHAGFSEDERRSSCLWFDLELMDLFGNWKGKLIVGWPGKELSFWRWSDRNVMPVLAILEDSALDAAMPPWDKLELTWEELRAIPTRWKTKLSEWRAIYYIFDTSDRRGYVGFASGAENLLGRWLNYADRGHGDNRLLIPRDPRNFVFTILERLNPDLDPAEVSRIESTWKNRLHTRSPIGLNDN